MPGGRDRGGADQGGDHVPVGDIRQVKQKLRQGAKARRRALDEADKRRLDALVCRHTVRLYQYRRARTVLCYLSTPIEVGTHDILRHAFAHGKRIALPRCVEGTRLMDFYLIESADDLERGAFGLLEPKRTCRKLSDFSNSVCLVPALLFDREGYRMGYGGGYYDRFLCGYRGPKVGLIYSRDIYPALPHGRFERPVDLIASDVGFFYVHRKDRMNSRLKGEQPKHGGKTR